MVRDTPLAELDSPYAERAGREHALELGMWVFLASESLLFSGLFAVYVGYRARYPLAFAHGVATNNEWIGGANTLILLVSSFFVAWAVHALRTSRVRASLASLLAAVMLGFTFLTLKGLEYREHWSAGIAPGTYWRAHDHGEPGQRLFFTLYYLTTGLHALHVIAGIVILLWLATRVARGRSTASHHVELELGGLYWHLVDIVWIFLWPLLYLIR
jgi:cytochrome c oxidase subunit 3